MLIFIFDFDSYLYRYKTEYEILTRILNWCKKEDGVTWHSKCEANNEKVVELGHHDLVQVHHFLHLPLLVTSTHRMVLGAKINVKKIHSKILPLLGTLDTTHEKCP